MFKRFFSVFAFFLLAISVSGCSTNPATGASQFTALMSPQQEVQIGAQEHENIVKQFGLYADQDLQNYVNQIGGRVVQNTERPEVQYKFYLLDSPVVNAFALPGGYIYLTRGLMALANNESEMASVLAHETGHITARHSAERYSRGVVTSLGAMILATAIGSSGASEAIGLGSDLYLKSYSRGQENEADTLGIRYLTRAGYSADAMAGFLRNLQAEKALQDQIDGRKSNGMSYFSTHPATGERVSKTVGEARQFPQGGQVNRDAYLKRLDGMVYGDSAKQGFSRGRTFYHPAIGFKFSVPDGYRIVNQPTQVLALSQNGTAIVFDFVPNPNKLSPMPFLKDVLMEGKPVTSSENITVNTMPAATASFEGNVNGKTAQIRLVAIKWSETQMVRFQIAMPQNLSAADVRALQTTTYSFARLTAQEKTSLKPYKIKVVTAKSGDSVSSLASRMAPEDYKDARFRVLNGLSGNDGIVAGNLYKLIVE